MTSKQTHSSLINALFSDRGILAVLITTQLIAMIYVISSPHSSLLQMGMSSLFVHSTSFFAMSALFLSKTYLSSKSLLIQVLAMSFAFLLATLLLSLLLPELLYVLELNSIGSSFEFTLNNLLICVCVLILLIHFIAIYAEHLSKLEVISKAEFDALQARIRPHFLFNSLNTIAELTSFDPQGAEKATLILARLSRAALHGHDIVSVESELSLVKDYIALEQYRFDDKLKIEWSLSNEVNHFQLPSLIIQPLVENALVYGGPDTSGIKWIKIDVHIEEEKLKVVIINQITNIAPKASGSGIALENIRQRLRLYFGKEAHLIINKSGDVYSVTMSAPLRRAQC